jgi:hypothetical protein
MDVCKWRLVHVSTIRMSSCETKFKLIQKVNAHTFHNYREDIRWCKTIEIHDDKKPLLKLHPFYLIIGTIHAHETWTI